jgi:hypothetical protein
MIELATLDRPAVLCLQEVPVWALAELERWSGMRVHGMVARPPRRPAVVTAWITGLHQGLFRSRLAGQANAVLVDPSLASKSLGGLQVSEPGWERRVVHVVRIEGLGVVANLHASNAVAAPWVPAAEIDRARLFLEQQAGPGEPRILTGDLNVRDAAVPGFENGGDTVDHILVAGATAGPLIVWPHSRLVQNGLVLSDHAPVERAVG